MRECRRIERLFASYVDGEARSDDRASVAAHVAGCVPCRRRLACEAAGRQVVHARRAGLHQTASAALRARCVAASALAIGASHPARWARLPRRTWVPVSLAAALLLAVVGVFMLGLTSSVDAIAAQLAVDHVKCFQVPGDRGPGVDAADAGRHWAQAQGWTLQVPPSVPSEQLELRGVRRCFTTDGRAAHLMYRWRGRPLSVFVLPQPVPRAGQTQTIVETFGHEAVMWSDRGRTYVVLAKGPTADMLPVVGYMRATAR